MTKGLFEMDMLIRVVSHVIKWVIACLIAVVLAVISQTQFVLARLSQLGADVSIGDRLSTTLFDIQHLGSFYGLFIAVALGIAFLVSGLLYHFIKFGRPIIYAVAGGTAIFVLLFSMKTAFFNIHIIAGARDFFGISLQVIIGILAGLIFARLTRKIPPPRSEPT